MKNILTIIFVILCNTALADSNNVMKQCLNEHGYDKENFDTFDFTKAAKCHGEYRAEMQKEKLDELRDFLDANPRYRVPGQSLNRCWGKPREMPFKKSTLSVGPDGMRASVWYKDKLPAGCYENAPWDNRDKKQ